MPCCEDCPCVNYCDGSMIEACMGDWRKRKQRESEVKHDGITTTLHNKKGDD